MEKKKLYVDIDDTYVDTERYLYSLLQANGFTIPKPGLGYVYELAEKEDLREIIEDALSDYTCIPKKAGASEAFELLSTEYDIVFCSNYTYEKEFQAKLKFAEEEKKKIILCGEENPYKSKVDMSDAIFIENNPFILDKSNAKIKIQMCDSDVAMVNIATAHKDRGLYAIDWYSIVDYLMEVNVSAELRRCFCEGIQEFRYSGE